VSGRTREQVLLPWLLCAASLSLYVLSTTLRWSLRDAVPAEHEGWVEGLIGTLGFVGIPVVGALIASRLPASPIGWLWCATGLAYGVADVAEPLVRVIGVPAWVGSVLASVGIASLIGLLIFVFLLFPDGRLPSYRWRWVARAAVAGPVLALLEAPFIHDREDPTADTPWLVGGTAGRYLYEVALVTVYGLFGIALAAMFSLVLRFRRAGAVERRQLTWFLYAAVVNAVVLVLDSVLRLLPPTLVTAAASAAAFALLPVAVGIAMLRYRLFEIDRIVSRTVSYGLLTGCLVVLYLVLVALLRALLEPLTGSSTVAVAVSTLAVAAVFNPVRRRLQAAVDRRFDRARYDAGQAVEAFAARLRNQVDLDQITEGLYDTVSSTVTPGRMAVWLRAPERPTGSAP
jgi:hypothetical protein